MENNENSASGAEPENRWGGELAGDLKDKLHDVAQEQQHAAANRIGGLAHATDRAADELAKHVPQAADALHGIAQRLESAASTLREKDVDELIHKVSDLARAQPVAFFAGQI